MRGRIALAGCLVALSTVASTQTADRQLTTKLVNAQGQQVGTATLVQTPHGVLMAIDVAKLSPGEHALHFHQIGQCDPKTGFKSAGEHYAPRSRQHGFFAEKGPHAGDMPNQFVRSDGRLQAHVLNPYVTLTGGDAPLRDGDGSALVVHAGADDYLTQPSGDAGDRVACGVIR